MHYNQTGEQPCPALWLPGDELGHPAASNLTELSSCFSSLSSVLPGAEQVPGVLHNPQSWCLQEMMKAEILAAQKEQRRVGGREI